MTLNIFQTAKLTNCCAKGNSAGASTRWIVHNYNFHYFGTFADTKTDTKRIKKDTFG